MQDRIEIGKTTLFVTTEKDEEGDRLRSEIHLQEGEKKELLVSTKFKLDQNEDIDLQIGKIHEKILVKLFGLLKGGEDDLKESIKASSFELSNSELQETKKGDSQKRADTKKSEPNRELMVELYPYIKSSLDEDDILFILLDEKGLIFHYIKEEYLDDKREYKRELVAINRTMLQNAQYIEKLIGNYKRIILSNETRSYFVNRLSERKRLFYVVVSKNGRYGEYFRHQKRFEAGLLERLDKFGIVHEGGEG
jgi:hypothetical protein